MAGDLNRSIKVYIDNSDAMAKSQALESRITKLRGELEKLNAQGKRDSKEALATEKALRQLEKTYGNYQHKIQETERILKNLSGATRGELESVRNQLRKDLKKTERGTVEYTEKLKAYHRVQKEITVAQKEMNSQLGAQGTFMSRLTNGFNKYFGIITAFLGTITGISFTFRKLSQDAAEYDDIYSDVMKTTSMTKDEVLELNEAFKKIDTRTSRENLNAIAEAGGRIGIAKKDIEDFAESMNVVNVALGDSFTGGVEEISTKLGKLKNLFQETKDMEVGDAYIKIGSAVNELGANGAASERNIADFTLRVGSMPDALKPAVAEALALGAAFEESGIEAEIASRSYSIVLQRASTNVDKFARVMGMATQEVKDLINEDPLEFFLKFSESMKGMDATTTAETLKYLKINADGANKVIGAAANNTDRFRELLEMSNDAFREGTSVIDEYNLKNNNAAAQLEKRKKAFKDAAEELGNRLNPALLKSTSYVTYIVKLLPSLLDFLAKYGKYIAYLATVYVTYVAGLKLAALWNDKLKGALSLSNIQLKLQNALLVSGRVSVLAYNVVMGLLTGNLTRARAAWALLNKTMMASPTGLIMAGVVALAGAYILLQNNMKRARTEKQALDKINKQVAKTTAEERSQLDLLLTTARNEKLSKDQRSDAIRKLNDLAPEYLGNLTLENINTKEATKAVDEYTDSLTRNAQQKAVSDKMSELYMEKMEKETEIARLNKLIEDDKAKGFVKSNWLIQSGYATRIKIVQKSLDGVNKEIKAYKELGQTIQKANKPGTPFRSPIIPAGDDDFSGGFSIPEDEKDQKKKNKKTLEAFEEGHKQKLAALKKQLLEENKTEKWFTEESVKIQEEYFTNKIALQKKLGESTVDTEIQQLDFLLDLQKTNDEKVLTQLSESRNAMLLGLDEYLALEREKLQDQVDDGLITRSKYNSELIDLELYAARQRLDIAQEYELLIRESEFETTEARKKALEEAVKATKKATDDEAKAVEKSNKYKLKSAKDYETERERILDKYALRTAREQYNKELSDLNDYYAQGLLKEEEYQKAKFKLRMDYYAEYAKQAVSYADYVAGAVSAYHKAEADNLEAQKQRELSAAGDNADKRAEIEAKYAQKELDLKKKQANADAAVKIAQAISAGALAALQAYAQLGPIAGSVAAALLAVTTAAQIASIMAQRKAIMATTLDGSSNSSSGSGARVVTQRAAGKYDVIGADDGRLYQGVPYTGPAQTGFVSTPTLMGEQGRELIVSAPDLSRLQRHINYPLIINAINDARSGVVPQRASGKYDAIPDPAPAQGISFDPAIMSEVRDLLLFLKTNPLKSYVVLSELQRQQDLLSGSQNIGKK